MICYYFSSSCSYSYSSEDEDGAVRERSLSFTSEEYERLQTSYSSVKVQLNKLAEKLGMMCAVYKDMQLARLVKLRIAATSMLKLFLFDDSLSKDSLSR